METLRALGPKALAQHADAVFARFEDSAFSVRWSAWHTLHGYAKVEPATRAQYTDVVIARLESSYSQSRKVALLVLGQLEPATLAQHADAVAARLEDSCLSVRRLALETLGKLEPETLQKLEPEMIAQHADALVERLQDSDSESKERETALTMLGTLDPATLAQHADAVAARLEDSDIDMDILVRRAALKTLAKLEPATLAQHAGAVIARLEDFSVLVQCSAWDALRKLPHDIIFRKLPHDIIWGIDFDSYKPLNPRAFSYWLSKFSGRLRWYRFRIRWRVYRLVLYWYALPYRPSGPGHARDVAAWDRMNETRGQTPRLQPPEQSGAEADESTSSESLAAPTWTCHRCRYLNYGAIRCALCRSPQKHEAACCWTGHARDVEAWDGMIEDAKGGRAIEGRERGGWKKKSTKDTKDKKHRDDPDGFRACCQELKELPPPPPKKKKTKKEKKKKKKKNARGMRKT